MVCWQCYKDPMHAYDHGVAMHIIQAVVKTIHKLEVDLGLPKNTLMKRLTARMHNLCSSLDTKHTTLMGFTHQSIVTVFETLSTPGKKGQRQSPIVDALTDSLCRVPLAYPQAPTRTYMQIQE